MTGIPRSAAVLEEIKAHHSAYYIDHSVPPAPLLISNGFTDDLFPADEAIRYYNRIRSQYPDAPISMLFGDFGHMRAVNKPGDSNARDQAQDSWLDFYVKGAGAQPFAGSDRLRDHLPDLSAFRRSLQGRQLGGPGARASCASTHAAGKTVSASGGSPTVDTTFDPVSGGGACASASASDLPGVATYRLPAAAGNGYTLMGSPTVLATISSPAAELGARRTAARCGARRHRDPGRPPALPAACRDGATGIPAASLGTPVRARPRREARASPAAMPAARRSTATDGRRTVRATITVSKLDLRLPVLEGPGAGGQVVAAPALPLPCGSAIAQQYSSSDYVRATLGQGKLRLKGRKSASVPVDSAPGANACKTKVGYS